MSDTGDPPEDSPPDVLDRLTTGEIDVLGRIAGSSNYTFLASVGAGGADRDPGGSNGNNGRADQDTALLAVYKPGDGERPLWDFPGGLYQREVAAYALSAALDWNIVPETVERTDAPLGTGSLQRFIDADFDVHYFHLAGETEHHDALVTVAVFDILANNTDRKAGHLLIDGDGRIWAIDNGLSFHEEPKLRTVIWDFAGEPIPDKLMHGVERAAGCDPEILDPLLGYLDAQEIEAVAARAQYLVRKRRLPQVPPDSRPYPWPLI